MEYIQLKKDNIIRIGIKDSNGIDTGEHLEFDLESVDLPLNYQKCIEMHKKNLSNLKKQILMIDKRNDKKGNKLFSANEEEKIKAIKKFYIDEIKALDLFLGKNGTKKLLNGRAPYYSMFEDIIEMLEPILPIIEKGFSKIEKKVIDKYKVMKDDNILE